MRAISMALGVAGLAAVLTAACGGGGDQPVASDQQTGSMPGASAPAPATPASGQAVQVTFRSEPDPPRMGENTFEAMVMSNGQPVTDADVSVEFFMAAMPSMNMAEMRNSVPLKHEGGGRYRGTGNVMMAGSWDATVRVKRGDQELGAHKVSVTAK